jgi:hypothetical protein
MTSKTGTFSPAVAEVEEAVLWSISPYSENDATIN